MKKILVASVILLISFALPSVRGSVNVWEAGYQLITCDITGCSASNEAALSGTIQVNTMSSALVGPPGSGGGGAPPQIPPTYNFVNIALLVSSVVGAGVAGLLWWRHKREKTVGEAVKKIETEQ